MHETWIQIPTPGDHYSPRTGSALITIVYEFSRVHERRGGHTKVLVARDTTHDYPHDEHFEFDSGGWPSKPQKIVDAGLGTLGLPRVFGPRQYRGVLEGIAPDFAGPVFVHNNPSPLAWLAKNRPRAQVCSWANNEIWRPYGRAEMQRIEASVHRLLCCSQFIADRTRESLGRDSEKIRLARSGVNTEKFAPRPELRDEDTPTILFVGRVQPIKGPHLLVEAAKKLGNRRFKLRIVGSQAFDSKDPLSDYEKQLRESAAPLGEKVEFLPAVDRFRVIEEYQKASIFCAPTMWDEPFTLAIMESMACGLPTVTTRRGGNTESGADAALYFDAQKPDSLVGILAELLDFPEKRARAGENARARALQLSWDAQYDALRQSVS